jgi:hypothetical protein
MSLLTTFCFPECLEGMVDLRVKINVFAITFFTKTGEKYLIYHNICQFITKILADLRV